MSEWDISNDDDWRRIRRLCGRCFRSSLHFSVATNTPQGQPHVAPIGSLRLLPDRTGYYFEIFTRQTVRNLEQDKRLTILGVNSGKLFWLRSLWGGAFVDTPGIQLTAEAGPRRKASPEERAWWRRMVYPAHLFKGHDLLWGDDCLTHVREVAITGAKPLSLGRMTADT